MKERKITRNASPVDSDERKGCGVIYAAFGYEHFVKTIMSARSLKEQSNVNVCVVTNIQLCDGDEFRYYLPFDDIIYVNAKSSDNRHHKINVYHYSPYHRTLYLDTDTVVSAPVDQGFAFLEYYDFAIRLHHYPVVSREGYDADLPFEMKLFSHWNSGVFFFVKKKQVEDFFDAWHQNYNLLGVQPDQPALAKTMLQFSRALDVLSLHLGWNVDRERSFALDRRIYEHNVIDHYRLSRKKTKSLFKIHKELQDLGVLEGAKIEGMNEFNLKFSPKYSAYRRLKKFPGVIFKTYRNWFFQNAR